MERPDYLNALDDYFSAEYSDYAAIGAIEGYDMPELLYVAPDGNVARRDSSRMRLCYQRERDALLERFKRGLTDTEFTFSFSFPRFFERLRDLRGHKSFHKLLPAVLARCGETAEGAGEKLAIEPRFWRKMVKGRLYPEKGTILALALVCHMQAQDAELLLASRGMAFEKDSVRDVVVEYLIEQRVFNEEMRDRCLSEYSVVNLPIRRADEGAGA